MKQRFALLASIFMTTVFWGNTGAAQTTLICNNESRPGDVPVTVELNEANKTASLHYPPHTITVTKPPTHVPAKSLGPFSAAFSQNEITFGYTATGVGDTLYNDFRINRLTGVMHQFYGHGAKFEKASQNMRVMYEHRCEVAKAKF